MRFLAASKQLADYPYPNFSSRGLAMRAQRTLHTSPSLVKASEYSTSKGMLAYFMMTWLYGYLEITSVMTDESFDTILGDSWAKRDTIIVLI